MFFRALRKLRLLPRDLFAAINRIADRVERQHILLLDVRGRLDVLETIVRSSDGEELAQLGKLVESYHEMGRLFDLITRHSIEQARWSSEWAHRLADWKDAINRMYSAIDLREADLDSAYRTLSIDLQSLREIVQGGAILHRSHQWKPEVATRVRAALARLCPYQAEGVGKKRFGHSSDGGYVMLDDFTGVEVAASLGIKDDVSWDLAMAAKGLPVIQFDPTISAGPVENPLFQFFRKRVCGDDGASSISFNRILQQRQAADNSKIVVKMDIEGDEFAALLNSEESLLDLCSQIVCEFHGLARLADAQFCDQAHQCWDHLSKIFFVVHVHANNCADLVNIGNTAVPEVLEVTFANRRYYQPVDSPELFPTAIDMPNQEGRADIFLGTFRFH